MKQISLAHVAGLCLLATTATAETPVLTVLTYDSFTAEWGPGPAIEAGFEETCGCDVQFVTAGDGAALLARVQLEGATTDIDVVTGLDTTLTETARQTGLFAAHGLSPDLTLPIDWSDADFLPFDWGYFAFVGNAGAEAPTSFRVLADSDLKVVIEDPRSSTPGLGLLMWVKAAYGDQAAALWSDLADNIVTVTPGWSEAYGMFLNGEADAVLSYTTSPAYHLIAEGDASKVAWAFDEGHYMQVEVSGILAGSDQPALARDFLSYLTSIDAQSVLPTTNWMYPAAMAVETLPDGFDQMIQPVQALLFSAQEAAAIRDVAVDEWRAALSR